jgi:hypothetical protein
MAAREETVRHISVIQMLLDSEKRNHYGTNAVFFYLETVLFLCFKHRAVFF